jgi:hypothetical protein
MNGKKIFGIAAILLVMQVFLGMSLACNTDCNNNCNNDCNTTCHTKQNTTCPDCNQLDFYNYVNTSNANVQVYQEGSKDVSFTNNMEVRNGSIDFTQFVNSGEWKLTNKAYLEGTRVTFQGVTIGAEDCTNCSNGEIKFNQHIEVDGYLDPWAYQKIENAAGTTILEQEVNITPGGWMRVNQSGYACADCEKGFLAQDGWLHSPIGGNNMAWQAGLVDGNRGYNEVNAEWWLNFNQVVSFNMN